MPTNFIGVFCGLSHEKQKDTMLHPWSTGVWTHRPFRDDEGPSNIAVSGQVLLLAVQPIQSLEGQALAFA